MLKAPHRSRIRVWCRVATAIIAIGCFAATAPAHAESLLTPALRQALTAQELGVATSSERALLFANNDAVNLARLNGWITDGEYQAAQNDFARLNQRISSDAAAEENAHLDRQRTKSSRFSPGTDSDYILKVESAEQVRRIQDSYNRRVNQFLAENGVADQRNDWHRKLDVDFMADPAHVSQEEFERIADANNAAYRRREAAEFERISRANDGSQATPAQYRAYAEEMRDFVQHKAEMLDALRADPDLLTTDGAKAAEFHRLMAQEQKYVERIGAANQLLRAQQGLPPSDAYEPRYTVEKDANGNNVLVKAERDADGRVVGETLAELGAKRSPENYRVTAAADSVAGNSVNRALAALAQSMGEAAAKNPSFRAAAPEMIASLTDNMSAAEKGAVIEHIRDKFGDAQAGAVAKAMRGEATESTGVSLRKLDERLAAALDGDLGGASRLRQGFNEQASKALGALETIGQLKSYYDTAMLARAVIGLMQRALDPSLSPEEREKVQAELDTMFWELAKNHGFSLLLQRMPTVAAFYGTWSIAYDGTRLVLENTATGERLNAAVAAYADRNLRAAEAFGADMREYLGLDTDRARQERLYQSLLSHILADIRAGRLRLREGKTARDVGDALRDRDVARLRNEVIVSAAQAPGPALVAARKLRAAMADAVKRAQGLLPDLQKACSAGEAAAGNIDAALGAIEQTLTRNEAASRANSPTRPDSDENEIASAQRDAAAAVKTVSLARSVAEQHKERACRAAKAIAKTASNQESKRLAGEAQSSADQTAAALSLAKSAQARLRSAASQIEAALAPHDRLTGGGDPQTMANELGEARGVIDEAAGFGTAIDSGRTGAFAASVEAARRAFGDAGKRIEGGAAGEELAVLKEARAAYVSLADANDALARCRDQIAADVTAARGRFDRLGARVARLATAPKTGGKARLQDVAAHVDAAEEATAQAVSAIDRADSDAATCAENAKSDARPATVTAWFKALSAPAKQQFLELARRAGMRNDDGSAYSAQQFSLLTSFFDIELNKLNLSLEAKRKRISEFATGKFAMLAPPLKQ